MKKYLMLWLLGLTLFLISSFWIAILLSGSSGSDGAALFLLCIIVHFVSFCLCIYFAACGAWDAAREEIKRREQEKNKVS